MMQLGKKFGAQRGFPTVADFIKRVRLKRPRLIILEYDTLELEIAQGGELYEEVSTLLITVVDKKTYNSLKVRGLIEYESP